MDSTNKLITYMLGFLFVVAAMVGAALLLGVPTTWVALAAVALLGIGIMVSVSKTQRPAV